MAITANPGKQLTTMIDGVSYHRLPIKTHLISDKDSIIDVVKKYVSKKLKSGDIVVVSERIVAISQGRSYLIKEIHPSGWAVFLSKFVHNHPGGIGLRNPATMQLAIQEAGLLRILCAAGVAVLTKPFGLRGMFYHVAGHGVNAIDGPCEYTLPPGNVSAKLGPKNPKKVARSIAKEIGCDVVIIDANDYGVNILGTSKGVNRGFVSEAFGDNPMGQADEQTPIVILRKI